MAKVSVIIPSRNEQFLIPTIEECFKQSRGELEVVAVLEGYWPDGWKELVAKYPNLHTIHHGEPKGMRPALNAAAASAISRGAKFLLKLDAHCMVDEGFDVALQADIEPNWIVVPRRKRLDAENWCVYPDGRPDIDYHYLSFPDNPKDFGGPGLNGKVWEERARERYGKPEYDIDDEMSSQGSGWFMHVDYFRELELMDTENYGPFWNEFQELGCKAWLSGGAVKVNKKTWYAHLHKGKKYGRGYNLDKSWLSWGATYTRKWLFNEAWHRQTLPFSSLIERFWPVPGWPENWEEIVYGATGRNSMVAVPAVGSSDVGDRKTDSLTIHSAYYGVGTGDGERLDVRNRLYSLIQDNALDIIVNNSTLDVGNPFRGQRKTLWVTYSYNDGEPVTVQRQEKDWLIIGKAARSLTHPQVPLQDAAAAARELQSRREQVDKSSQEVKEIEARLRLDDDHPAVIRITSSATALNDLLIRRFGIHDRRLRGPMPIEIPTFHRDDLAALFAELGFTRGAEIGVAEGKYSEVLLKANPQLHLLLVDPWHAYSSNPQNKSQAKNEFAYNETIRRTKDYPNVKLDMRYSMDAVWDVADGSLDFVYIDAHHSYPFVMSDLIFWSQKVRSGGIVSGDDVYQLDPKWGAGPMEAVYDYTRAMKINPWWLINAHRSVDFFYVKP